MWKVDSKNITNFEASIGELQSLILFWILAAGKTASGSERILNELLIKQSLPFTQLQKFTQKELSIQLQKLGCGCFNNKARSIYEIVNSNFDLKTCSIDELESIFGIGKKTSRGFILHTRKNAKYAVLDVHILKFLNSEGYPDIPKSTPSNKFEYTRLEKYFLSICRQKRISPSKFDLKIWNSYANNKKSKLLT